MNQSLYLLVNKHLRGLARQFVVVANSFRVSTLLGALNGYVLSKWRFPASETLFICLVLGVFMPGQTALLPWAYILFGVVFTGGTQQAITAALVALSTSQMNARPNDVASAAVMIGAVPPLLIYLFGGKYFVRGLTQGAIK